MGILGHVSQINAERISIYIFVYDKGIINGNP